MILSTNLKNLKHEIQLNKKRFFLDDTTKICAGGMLLYKIVNKELYLLMSFSNNYYEDIGGRIDITDDTIYDTVIREVREETNNIINLDIVELENTYYNYNKIGKYIIFLVKANDIQKKLNSSNFGNYEIHDNIKRTIEWINYNDIYDNKVNISPRVSKNFIINTLINIV